LAAGNETGIGNNIATPVLPAGSVTVLQAPFPKTFTLNMGNKQLTLNQGYKLQDINITSSVGSGDTAVTINHPTAGLASVEVTCSGSNVKCVEVVGGGGFHILKDVVVEVQANSSNVGIKNNANLSIVGGEVRLTGTTAGIKLIESQGILTVTGLTVDMTGGITGGTTTHTQNSTGIFLNAPGSLVTNSTIKVNKCTASGNSIGIDVQHMTGKSTVVGNNFIGYGDTSGCPATGVRGGTKLSPAPDPPNNNFLGALTNTVLP
jgi:hypothetical protein